MKGKKRRLQNKDENRVQHHCVECDHPINENNYNSEKMKKMCGSCYRTCVRQNVQRKNDKKLYKIRKNQRDFKNNF
jgi:predicted sulfurtransferase